MTKKTDFPEPVAFSDWLKGFIKSLEGENDAYVPCGDCVGCCTSSYFIHIKPSDTESIKRIPKELLFPAPGLPKGNYLLGYDENGHCPMFKNNKCSIYQDRPETCRQYDCRVFSATGILPEEDKEEIVLKVKGWQFDLMRTEDTNAYRAVQSAARFLMEFKDSFPKGFLPKNTAQQAVMAVRIHKEFIEEEEEMTEKERTKKVDIIVSKYGHKYKQR